MMGSRMGEFAALLTAISWTFGALAFESACKKAGSLAVNWIRLVMGFFLLSIFCLFYRGLFLPIDASAHTWFWLSLSGIIGFAIGDLFLFQAFIEVGSRISMLIMASVPPMTALIGWGIMGETLSNKGSIGMVLTITGIALVVLERKTEQRQVRFSHPVRGIVIAFGGALGQSVGLVFSKYGMGSYDAFAATQIRIISGTAGFTVIIMILRKWKRIHEALANKYAMKPTTAGAFLGPFIGVSLSLFAIQHTTTGIASTIMAIVPVLIIPPAVILFKEKVTVKEIIGAVIAVSGVSVLFI